MTTTNQLIGIEDFRAVLLEIPKQMRRKLLRESLTEAARPVLREVQGNTPVLRNDLQSPIRSPGTLRRAEQIRVSKVARQNGAVGVFINVRPLPGAKFKVHRTMNSLGRQVKGRVLVKASQRSASNPDDPFYWRFVNFGTVKMPGAHFLETGARRFAEAVTIFEKDLGPKIEVYNQRVRNSTLYTK